MYKDANYKEKFTDLKEWFPYVIEIVKKDLRNEHLKKDPYFIKKFLSSKNIHKLTTEELAEAYLKAIQEEEKGEEIGEFITSRWLLKNSDLYEFFEQELTKIDPDFSNLEEIAPESAMKLIGASIDQFGAPETYLFSVLNSVVFPKETFTHLQQLANTHKSNKEEQAKQIDLKMNAESIQKNYEREMARMVDKYEKKLSGLQKKYVTDVENFKKQVAQLQRKLQEKHA